MAVERLERLMTSRQITAEMGISRSTIYRLSRAGLFPEPIRIGPRGMRWLESEIKAWLLERRAAVGENDGLRTTDASVNVPKA